MHHKKSFARVKNKSRLSLGFTIVELLVVIVVISILAAITIVSYAGITLKATAATLQSDLKNASTQLEIDKTINGTYPATAEAANGGRGLKPSPDTVFNYTYTSVDNTYGLTATKSDVSYHITSDNKTPTIGELPTAPIVAGDWQIATSGSHSCFITNNKIYCWGDNSSGQLGNNSYDSSSIPVAVDTTGVLSGKTITAISAGDMHNCVIADNQAYCWGYGGDGELGNNTTNDSPIPVAVDTTGVLSGKTITAISAGAYHSCVAASGQAYCWGANWEGQLGDNSANDSLIPVAVDTTGVLNGKIITTISASAGGSQSCVVSDRKAYCWGYNGNGELGNNSYNNSNVPVAVDDTGALSGKVVTAISSGTYHTCAIASGQAYCWASNDNGELGDNSHNGSTVPVAVNISGVLSGKTITSITAGNSYTCAIADSQAYCWGYNRYGKLGNNSLIDSSVPIAVDATGVLSGKIVTAISGYYAHSCVIATGKAYCWGYNNAGQLGNNTIINSSVPIVVDTTNIP